MKYEFVNGINENPITGGICAHIRADNGKYWWADLSYTYDRGIEFMAFPASLKGKVISWSAAYESHPKEITEEAFKTEVENWLGGGDCNEAYN